MLKSKTLKIIIYLLTVVVINFSLISCNISHFIGNHSKTNSAQNKKCNWKKLRSSFKLHNHDKNKEVQQQIDWLINNQTYIEKLTKQSSYYLPFIIAKLQENNLPGELALLPMIESSYNPFAHSEKGAAGLWQIMPKTGKLYGIKQNWWYDGRRDLIDSTYVAIEHLKYLYNYFNQDWLLALAAYNSGEKRVKDAIEKNIRAGKKTDFWSISLPKQTYQFVPKILALAEVIKKPDKYNITLPTYATIKSFDVIHFNHQVDLTEIAKLAEMDLYDLYVLNPGYNRWITHPNGPHKVIIPVENKIIYNKNMSPQKNTLPNAVGSVTNNSSSNSKNLAFFR